MYLEDFYPIYDDAFFELDEEEETCEVDEEED